VPGPTQGHEKRLGSSHHFPCNRHPILCHPDRSEAERRDLRFRGPLMKMFFYRAQRSVVERSAVFLSQSFDFDPAEPYLSEFYFNGDFSAG
jgi:hypothetical protein